MELDRERGHRPLAFDKMEGLVREMQDPESGVPVRSQKLFLTSIPSAFMGYDLIEWLIERLKIEESEALSIANQLCQYGYFFPVSDSKNLVVKDDSSLYRFQSPYFWPWQLRTPDNVEYAIYLAKRTLRNKQRHGLEDYELESLNNLKKNLANKWDFITMQAEEQVRLAKDRKKGDKIVSDSQERAYWRVYRPPPGVISPLEQCPVPNRSRNGGGRPRKRTLEDLRREVDLLRNCLSRTRVKVSVALESMVQSVETFAEYDPLITGTQPSNPWVSEDLTFWQLNGSLVEVPTEKRVKRWALSMEELVSDPTGLQEFTNYLRKEYSHENIRFWLAVSDLRRSSQSQIQRKVCEIFEEFLAPGAPCEINIDGKTMERVHQELRNPSRFTFDSAAEHVYALLLKKDCYPRFIRSEHYKNLLATGIQPSHKKRFFGFVGPTKKKASTTVPPNPALLQQVATASSGNANAGSALSRRRGSDRSLSGSAHELAVSGVRDSSRVPHSHSQSNLSDIPYRETAGVPSSGSGVAVIEPTGSSDVCPWDSSDAESSGCRVKKPSISVVASTSEDVCPWEAGPPTTRKNSTQFDSGSSSSDLSAAIADASERLRRSCGISSDGDRRSQHTRKLSTASYIEPRRASVSAVSTSVRPSDITRPSVSSFDDFASARSFDSTSPDVRDSDDVIRRDIQTVTKTFKKSHSLKKTGSVTSSSVAPIISVSSVMDDTIDDAGESEAESEMATVPPASVSEESSIDPSAETEKHPQEEPAIEEEKEEASDILAEEISIEIAIETNTPELSSSPQPECSSEIILPNIGLAPLAEPDGASPISEWAPDSDLQSEIGPHIETGVQEETAIQTETKNNDVCPWEDEETCKVDAPFVKTYATLGYL